MTLLFRLTAGSLYTDEAFTFAVAGLNYAPLLQTLTVFDYHPPLFYLATHVAMRTLHWPLWDYRYLMMPFGLLTVVATWVVGRRIGGNLTAGVAALAVALAPALMVYDRMYRMYAVLVALTTVSWWLLVELEPASGRKRGVLLVVYGATCLVLAYTHYLGLLAIACQVLFVVTRRRQLLATLWVYGAVALSYVPWLPHLRQQLALGGLSEGRPGIDAGLASSISSAFFLGLPSFGVGHTADWIISVIVVVVMATGAWLGRQTVLPFWLLAFVAAFAGSIIFGKNLAYFNRYLLIDIPPGAIALGLIVNAFASSGKAVASFAVAAVALGLVALCSSNVLFDPYYQFPDWYAVDAMLAVHEHPGDGIILDAAYEYLVVQNFSAFRNHATLGFMSPSDFPVILHWIATHPNVRIWYIQHQNYYWDPHLRIRAALAQRPLLLSQDFARQLPVNDVTVMLFGKVPMTK